MIEPIELPSFAGGMVQGEAAVEFPDETWAKIAGLVLSDSGSLRSQWFAAGRAALPAAPDNWIEVGDPMQLLVKAGIDWRYGAGMWSAAAPTMAAATLPSSGRLICAVPAGRSGLGFDRAALVVPPRSTSAKLWSYDGVEQVTSVTDRYPNDTTADAMPEGRHGVMWGDFLVLGDIWWLKDEAAAFSSTNERRYPEGLWFAQPGNVLRWDPLDVEFVGLKQEGREARITGLIVTEDGLLVATTAGTWLLRGTPSDHEFEMLSPLALDRAQEWRGADGIIGVSDGDLWFLALSGEPQRIAVPEPYAEATSVASWRDWALVTTGSGRMFAGRLLPDRAIAWSELTLRPDVDLTGDLHVLPSDDGFYVFDGSGVWTFSAEAGARGHMYGAGAVMSELVSPTLTAGPWVSTGWRSVGVGLREGAAAGSALQCVVRAGAFSDGAAPSLTTATGRPVVGRMRAEARAPGPSVDMSFGWTFEGDVDVESAAVWAFKSGRGER